MNMEEYLKKNPDFAAKISTPTPQKNKPASAQNAPKKAAAGYYCPVCKADFAKPKKVTPGSFAIELAALIIFVGGGLLMLGVLGACIGFFLAILVSLIRSIFAYKCCPNCGSRNFCKR